MRRSKINLDAKDFATFAACSDHLRTVGVVTLQNDTSIYGTSIYGTG